MSPLQPLVTVWRNWPVFAHTTLGEVRSRYAGSLLGIVWMFLAPMLLMTIYAIIYLAIFNVRPAEMPPSHYVLYVLSGLVPFLGFSDGLSAGSGSLSANRAILLSTVFPAELVPLRAVVASQAPTIVGMGICLIAASVLGLSSLSFIALPLIWLLLLMFVTGVVWVLALANLLLKDVQHALGFVNMILLIASPIGYTEAAAPLALRPWLKLNPLAHYIEAMHDAVVFGRFPRADTWAVMLVCSMVSFAGGYWLFQRAKRALFDYA